MVPLVVVVIVVVVTYHRAAVVIVMVMGMMTTRIPTWFLVLTLDPGQTFKTMSNREHDYHKWSLTICDGCLRILKGSKMRS